MSKHTPGPWVYKYDKTSEYGRFETLAQNPRLNDPVICAVREDWIAYLATHTEGQANARLIAAAPDLLEALKACLDSFACAHAHKKTTICACDMARAAIAKAEGQP